MELCPQCGRMTAERSHYTGILICYNRDCLYGAGGFGFSGVVRIVDLGLVNGFLETPNPPIVKRRILGTLEKKPKRMLRPVED